MKTHRPHARLAFGQGRASDGNRELPEEVAVAVSYNGLDPGGDDGDARPIWWILPTDSR